MGLDEFERLKVVPDAEGQAPPAWASLQEQALKLIYYPSFPNLCRALALLTLAIDRHLHPDDIPTEAEVEKLTLEYQKNQEMLAAYMSGRDGLKVDSEKLAALRTGRRESEAIALTLDALTAVNLSLVDLSLIDQYLLDRNQMMVVTAMLRDLQQQGIRSESKLFQLAVLTIIAERIRMLIGERIKPAIEKYTDTNPISFISVEKGNERKQGVLKALSEGTSCMYLSGLRESYSQAISTLVGAYCTTSEAADQLEMLFSAIIFMKGGSPREAQTVDEVRATVLKIVAEGGTDHDRAVRSAYLHLLYFLDVYHEHWSDEFRRLIKTYASDIRDEEISQLASQYAQRQDQRTASLSLRRGLNTSASHTSVAETRKKFLSDFLGLTGRKKGGDGSDGITLTLTAISANKAVFVQYVPSTYAGSLMRKGEREYVVSLIQAIKWVEEYNWSPPREMQ